MVPFSDNLYSNVKAVRWTCSPSLFCQALLVFKVQVHFLSNSQHSDTILRDQLHSIPQIFEDHQVKIQTFKKCWSQQISIVPGDLANQSWTWGKFNVGYNNNNVLMAAMYIQRRSSVDSKAPNYIMQVYEAFLSILTKTMNWMVLLKNTFQQAFACHQWQLWRFWIAWSREIWGPGKSNIK